MSTAIRSYLGKRDYDAYKAGVKRSRGAIPYDLNRRRVYAPRSMPAPPQAISAGYGYLRNRNAGVVRAEKKVIDLNQAVYAVENTGTQLALLNGCVAGSQNFNRIGRKIQLKSLQIRGYFLATDDTVANTFARMVIVYDKQPNGAAPTWANIITSQNIAGTTSSTATDMVNLDNRDRFEIIRDKTYTLSAKDTTATQAYSGSPTIICVEDFVKLGKRETCFNAGTAGTIGDITSGSLYVFFIASQPNATGVNYIGAFRTRFIDL